MSVDGLLPRRERGRSRRRPRSGRSLPRRRSRALWRPAPRLLIAIAVLGLLLGGGWLWLRDSSLVSVNRVTVTGETGPDAAQIRSALLTAARNMSTLDVRMDQLRTAVAPYPVVKRLQVRTQFPHGMSIRVIEQIPVGAVVVAGRTIPVAGDGTLLRDVVPAATLPIIPLRVPPGGSRLSELDALDAVALLAAAPSQLVFRISQVAPVPPHGLVAQIRNGPSIYFGDGTRLRAKWVAAAAVLADAGSAGAVYIDVTDPERPAAGAGSSGPGSNPAAGAGSSGGTTGAANPGGTIGPTATTASAGAAPTAPATGQSGSPTTTPVGG